MLATHSWPARPSRDRGGHHLLTAIPGSHYIAHTVSYGMVSCYVAGKGPPDTLVIKLGENHVPVEKVKVLSLSIVGGHRNDPISP